MWWLLRLDGLLPAVLLGLCVVPVTIVGGQAGVLQGERRWLPLSLLYLSVGVPRVLLGGAALAISATEASAMAGVLAASWLPVLIGGWSLPPPQARPIVTEHDREVRRDVRRETYGNSVALLAFFALSNLDIVVARNVLDDHQAGLYAGGLIVTKAVLFLPQFAVVIAVPGDVHRRREPAGADARLALLTALGVVCTPAPGALRRGDGLHRRRRVLRRGGPDLAVRHPRRACWPCFSCWSTPCWPGGTLVEVLVTLGVWPWC